MIVYEYDRHTRKMDVTNYMCSGETYRLNDKKTLTYGINIVYLVIIAGLMLMMPNRAATLSVVAGGIGVFILLQLFLNDIISHSTKIKSQRPNKPQEPCVGIEFEKDFSRYLSYVFVTPDKITIWHGNDLPYYKLENKWRVVSESSSDECSAMEYCVTAEQLKKELSPLVGYYVPKPYMTKVEYARANHTRDKVKEVIEKYFRGSANGSV